MAATIRDVDKLASVSISTVSRVINNTSNVNEETKLKVMESIPYIEVSFLPVNRALNYRIHHFHNI
jgi:DNA-binding LacI/PurR family transcriptional regulator